MGARVLLLDEDTSATNFMIRDRRMQELIPKAHEPITPFIDKVRPLYQDYGVSTVLVMGGSGDYFEAADQVIWMNNYRPTLVTREAREIAQKFPVQRLQEGGSDFGEMTGRQPQAEAFDSQPGTQGGADRGQGNADHPLRRPGHRPLLPGATGGTRPTPGHWTIDPPLRVQIPERERQSERRGWKRPIRKWRKEGWTA